MTSVINQEAFLRTSREYPKDTDVLSIELEKSYIDIANVVNNRTISLFPAAKPAQTGEQWFINNNRKQEGLRQIYPFSDSNLVIPHGLSNFTSISYFVRIWGCFFDGTNWWPLPYVDVVAADNQINISLNATDIVVTKGVGAPPAIVKGVIGLEWLSSASQMPVG
jgi:hypothetical protein